MEPQQDHEATAQAQAFNAKIEEVAGNLGVAIAASISIGTSEAANTEGAQGALDFVYARWAELGRSFAELIDMEPPR